ncbi:AHH domain-containing protein [Oxalobacteraceae bacterium]|nr:AHH domain-containing protein [Oxalobacteraceae bacterium]
MTGNVLKNKQYLELIKGAISIDLAHPRHHGVKMQAHHLISAEGMKQSNLSHEMKTLGYNINVLKNLVFIPCTLQGACYLKVQPHRGNHTAPVMQDEYDDDRHPSDYHDMVAKHLTRINHSLSKECIGDPKKKKELVQDTLNDLSLWIMNKIQNSPRSAPLTNIAMHFSKQTLIGCGGVDSVAKNKGISSCPSGRNHLKKQADGQDKENISYICADGYELRIGK